MGDEPPRCRRGVGQRVRGDMVAVRVADDGSWPRLTWIEPQPLLGKVDAAVPEDRVGEQGGVLLGDGGAFEELVAKRAVGAEALARRSGKHAGLAAGGAGLLLRLDRGLHRGDLEK